MTITEIKQLAQEYHTPGEKIKDDWHPAYKKECEKINRKHLENKLMNKYNVSGKINKTINIGTMLYERR